MGHRAWHNVAFPHVQRAWYARGAVLFCLSAWRMRLTSVHCKLRFCGANKAVSCKLKGDFPIKKSCISR